MRAIFWNVRGFGHVGRRTQLKEYMRKEGIDIVGLQETIKADFRHHELLAIDPLKRFSWNHLAASGHSGGMLLGFDQAVYERELVVIQVYGPADHSRSADFLGEVQAKVLAVSSLFIPLVVGGDFNQLIRSGADKNNDNINWSRVTMFNNTIANMALREVARAGARYTWTNKQLSPVR
ncbi:uncharacterized protein [Aegilops tauschii subsp. strangulata]|uniref:uncharacterized protein n=1 Tax=Aegilops tauschii subsp. strangulata TaxID=200361 RepID=UPI00098B8A46|nr:uncharacterized protein LOC109746280 [Aegilops tauschii subsp. strangulata]